MKNKMMKEKKIFTIEGIRLAFRLSKKMPIEEAEEEIRELDNLLSKSREELRQYRACFGESHNWLDTYSEKLRIAREVLDIAEEDNNIRKEHNL